MFLLTEVFILYFSASGVSLDSVYKSLNRTVLFQLSRSVDSALGQTQVLDALHKLTNNRSLVFGPSNYDQEFFGSLCYCLLNLTDDTANSASNLKEDQPIQTTWHVNFDKEDLSMQDPGAMSTKAVRKSQAVLEGLKLVSEAARRVWEELYLCKKRVLLFTYCNSVKKIDRNENRSAHACFS